MTQGIIVFQARGKQPFLLWEWAVGELIFFDKKEIELVFLNFACTIFS
jgi:hypothetical protein